MEDLDTKAQVLHAINNLSVSRELKQSKVTTMKSILMIRIITLLCRAKFFQYEAILQSQTF